MKQYLKMADVFRDVVQPERFNYAMANPKATYAAHAINSHDELVQMNQELLAALKLARNDTFYVSSGFAHAAWRYQQAKDSLLVIDAAIAKAKGGAA